MDVPNRKALAEYYGGRAVKQYRIGNANNAAEFAQAAWHHALEALNLRPREYRNRAAFSQRPPAPGSCQCGMA